MNSLYKLQINKLLSKKLIFVWLILIICNLDSRINSSLSSQQFVADALSNQYYILYFMMPMFLLIIISSLDDDNDFILIRSKTYWNFFKYRAYAYAKFSILFVLLQIIVIAIISIGMKNNNSFDNIDHSIYEALNFYSGIFSTPNKLTVYIALYMILGLFLTSLIIYTLNNFFNKSTTIKIIIIIYLLAFVSIKIPILKIISCLFINTYIIFLHGFIFGFGIKINLIIESLFILIIFKINKLHRNKDIRININSILKYTHKNIGIYKYYNKFLFNKYNMFSIILILFIMSIWRLLASFDNISINKYLINVFSGTLIGELNPLIILEMLVFNLTPIYLLSIFIEKESNVRNIFLNIRLKKSSVWFKSIIKISFKFILIYTILSLSIPIVISICIGINPDHNLFKLILGIFTTRLLNIIFEFLTLFLVYTFTKNITISFFTLILFNLCSAIPLKFMYYTPFGISSLCRYKFIFENHGLNFRTVILELLILISIIFIYLKSRYKKLIVK